MTFEELREVHVPDGCRLVQVIDHLDEGGPIIKVYERDKTPEEAARVRAGVQEALNRAWTNVCLRKASAPAAGALAGGDPAPKGAGGAPTQ